MTTPASGSISFSQIRNELDWNTAISLGSYRPRLLANKSTGTINTSDLYNKTAIGHSFTTLLTLPNTNWYTQAAAYTNGKYFYSANGMATPNNTTYLYKSDTGTSFSQVSSITSGAVAGYSNYYIGVLCGPGYASGTDVYMAYGNSFYIDGAGQHETVSSLTEAKVRNAQLKEEFLLDSFGAGVHEYVNPQIKTTTL